MPDRITSDSACVNDVWTELLERLSLRHGDSLTAIRTTGSMSDETAELINNEANELADLYTEK